MANRSCPAAGGPRGQCRPARPGRDRGAMTDTRDEHNVAMVRDDLEGILSNYEDWKKQKD